MKVLFVSTLFYDYENKNVTVTIKNMGDSTFSGLIYVKYGGQTSKYRVTIDAGKEVTLKLPNDALGKHIVVEVLDSENNLYDRAIGYSYINQDPFFAFFYLIDGETVDGTYLCVREVSYLVYIHDRFRLRIIYTDVSGSERIVEKTYETNTIHRDKCLIMLTDYPLNTDLRFIIVEPYNYVVQVPEKPIQSIGVLTLVDVSGHVTLSGTEIVVKVGNEGGRATASMNIYAYFGDEKREYAGVDLGLIEKGDVVEKRFFVDNNVAFSVEVEVFGDKGVYLHERIPAVFPDKVIRIVADLNGIRYINQTTLPVKFYRKVVVRRNNRTILDKSGLLTLDPKEDYVEDYTPSIGDFVNIRVCGSTQEISCTNVTKTIRPSNALDTYFDLNTQQSMLLLLLLIIVLILLLL